MLRVLAAAAFDTDPRLAELAVGVCLLACMTYVNMLAHAASAGGGRAVWVIGAALAFGSGVWVAHFIALIGLRTVLRPAFALAPIADSLALGHSLYLEVTAEGVETQTQLRTLRQYGCDQVQGFLLGRPTPNLDRARLMALSAAA